MTHCTAMTFWLSCQHSDEMSKVHHGYFRIVELRSTRLQRLASQHHASPLMTLVLMEKGVYRQLEVSDDRSLGP